MKMANGTVVGRVGVVPVCFEKLRELLGLPSDAVVRNVHVGSSMACQFTYNLLFVEVEHPDLPQLAEGQVMREHPIRRETLHLLNGSLIANVPKKGWPDYPA